MALSWAFTALGEDLETQIPEIVTSLGENAGTILDIIAQERAPITSSAGRLFDAVACLSGVCEKNSFEGECPQKLTAIADKDENSAYPFAILENILDPSPAICEIIEDRRAKVSPSIISARFHNGLAGGIIEMASRIAEKIGTSSILLSGGVFQNPLLLKLVVEGLREANLNPYWNRAIPPGDSGVALGQAYYGVLRQK
jgi:hydrogenase maturation protein HypF